MQRDYSLNDPNSALAATIDVLEEKFNQFIAQKSFQRSPYTKACHSLWGRQPNASSYYHEQQWECPQNRSTTYFPPQEERYQHPSIPQIQEKKYTTEDVLAKFMVHTERKFAAVDATLLDVQASLHKIENQIGELFKVLSELPPTRELKVEVPSGNSNKEEESKNEKNVEEDCGVLEVEGAEEVTSGPIEQALGIKVDQLAKHKREESGTTENVHKKLTPSMNPPMPGLDNSQPKIFPWRPKELLWAIQAYPTRVEEENLGSRLMPSKIPPMLCLNNSQPKLFPWRPKQMYGALKGNLVGIGEEAERKFKLYKDPPKPRLHNSQPKLFPWRPKGNMFKAPTSTSSRKVIHFFYGSCYATCSRDEYTLFKPP